MATDTQLENFATMFALAQQGDENAKSLLYRASHAMVKEIVKSKARRWISNTIDSDDITQEVWRTLCRSLVSLPSLSSRTEFEKIVSCVAQRQVRKHRRYHFAHRRDTRRQAALVFDVQESAPTASEHCRLAETLDQIREVTNDFEWRVIKLRLEGETKSEIARLFGVNEIVVRRTLKRVADRVPDLLTQIY